MICDLKEQHIECVEEYMNGFPLPSIDKNARCLLKLCDSIYFYTELLYIKNNHC